VWWPRLRVEWNRTYALVLALPRMIENHVRVAKNHPPRFPTVAQRPCGAFGRVPNLCVRWVVYCAGGLLELKGFNTCSAFDDFVG